MRSKKNQVRRRRRSGTPQLLKHCVRGTDYAYAVFSGEERRYGRFDDEARRLFDHDLAVWLANGRSFPGDKEEAGQLSVQELAERYKQHVRVSHGAAWRRNNEPRIRLAVDALARLHGPDLAADYGPARLKVFQQHLCSLRKADGETPRLSVGTISERLRIVQTAFQWAVSEELITSSVLEGLRAVPPLREGRPGTRGKRQVRPVERETVEATLPFLLTPVASLVEIMWWTGARPSELFGLRPCDIDRTSQPWRVELEHHKNSGKGRRRCLFFGPLAQAVLHSLLLRAPDAPLFDPRDAVQEFHRRRRSKRKTKLFPSHLRRYEEGRAARDAEFSPTYTSDTLRKAVQRGVVAANNQRRAEGADPIPMWSPYQLRHSAATRIRREHGIEAARVLLGHASAAMTEHYAEIDFAAAAKIMAAAG